LNNRIVVVSVDIFYSTICFPFLHYTFFKHFDLVFSRVSQAPMTILGSHDSLLVALSILIATAASYTALDLAGRIQAAQGWAKQVWLAAAAFAMGGSIWSMHFVAMLAFSMPNVPMDYNLTLTAISFALPILVTGVGFHVVNRSGHGLMALALSGLLMGLGIAGMHYTGMAAMRMPADLSYDSLWVTISVLIAIGASTVALWLAFRHTGLLQRLVAAVAMGGAISGMHYAAMQASHLHRSSRVGDHAHGHATLGQTNLAMAVAATTFLILFLALIAAMFDRRFALLAEREAHCPARQRRAVSEPSTRRHRCPSTPPTRPGLIDHVSDAWLDLLGYRREEVVGASDHRLHDRGLDPASTQVGLGRRCCGTGLQRRRVPPDHQERSDPGRADVRAGRARR
jgi:NO-binding membrane sensor protein with MHYT domain